MDNNECFRIRVFLECLHLAVRLLEQDGMPDAVAVDADGEPELTDNLVELAQKLYQIVMHSA